MWEIMSDQVMSRNGLGMNVLIEWMTGEPCTFAGDWGQLDVRLHGICSVCSSRKGSVYFWCYSVEWKLLQNSSSFKLHFLETLCHQEWHLHYIKAHSVWLE